MTDHHPHGLFTWADVSLPDPAAGRDFYTGLFGWDAEDQTDPAGNYIYTMFSKGDQSVAGMGPQPEAMAESGIPPMWNSYISVEDLDATLELVAANDGNVVVPAMDVMTAGRMAFIADPTGAVVALWQPGDHKGAGVFNERGALTWNELATRDTEAAKRFYGAVFGWGFGAFAGPNEYWLVTLDGKVDGDADADDALNGGIMAMDDNWPPEIPPHWMVYFAVDNTDEAVSALETLGGKVSVPPFDTPAGRIAVVGDPQGGTFSLLAPNQTGGSEA